MKKIGLMLGVALLTGVVAYSAAPEFNSMVIKLGDTLTVDSQYTSRWEFLDSVTMVKTDSCYTTYTISGHVEMDPTDRLYVGFIDGGGAPASTSTPVDTFVFYPSSASKSRCSIPFIATYVDSLLSQTDANDTIYFYVAKGGTSTPEKVILLDAVIECRTSDRSVAGAW